MDDAESSRSWPNSTHPGLIEQLNEVDVTGVDPLTGSAHMALNAETWSPMAAIRRHPVQRARTGRRLLRRAQGRLNDVRGH